MQHIAIIGGGPAGLRAAEVTLGVVRVVSSVADVRGFFAALEAEGLVGVYDGSLELDLSGEACAAVMADLSEVLEERGL